MARDYIDSMVGLIPDPRTGRHIEGVIEMDMSPSAVRERTVVRRAFYQEMQGKLIDPQDGRKRPQVAAVLRELEISYGSLITVN